MTTDEIVALSNESLRAIVASTNPNGKFAQQRIWAQLELRRRSSERGPRIPAGGVSFVDL